MPRRWIYAAACLAACLLLAGCRKESAAKKPAPSQAAPSAFDAPIGPPQSEPPPKPGMLFIGGGALVAGTPPDALPRIPNEEMPGEQLVLKGFYIDAFPYPNEEGAIPLTNVTQEDASALCKQHGKRLCSELEWERACKGPNNHTYEYGDEYRWDRCQTGSLARLRPSGILVGCVSDFGVRDMHGGVWEWTSSPWGRADPRPLFSVRGGNAQAGELVGRCANASAHPASYTSKTLGFRCCAGARNSVEVTLNVKHGKPLSGRAVDQQLSQQVLAVMPEEAKAELGSSDQFNPSRMWWWRPVGNEELVVLGGCGPSAHKPRCGVLVARASIDRTSVLAWASSGNWQPTLHVDGDTKQLWVLGGDAPGSFRRLIEYAYGELEVNDRDRRIPRHWLRQALRRDAQAKKKASEEKAKKRAKVKRKEPQRKAVQKQP